MLDELRFPDGARHLALEVFARRFFADPREFSGGELVAMFHTYFLGSAEGLLFDVPYDDYDTALWAPLGRYLDGLGRRGGHVPMAATRCEDRGEVRWPCGSQDEQDGSRPTPWCWRRPGRPAARGCRLPRLGGDDAAGEAWRESVAGIRSAPPFAVWRLWLSGKVAPERPPFLGTSGYGPLDNVSVLEQFEGHATRWSAAHDGSVVELHAYALPEGTAEADLRQQLLAELHRVYPETATLRRSCTTSGSSRPTACSSGLEPWRSRPGVRTPDPRVLLAGDAVRCDCRWR